MCELRDARAAQNRAAEALIEACLGLYPDQVGMALKGVYDSTLIENVPTNILSILERLPERPRARRR